MIIEIPSNIGIKRKVYITSYSLTETYINIDYDIIMSYKDKVSKVRGVSIFLINDDFNRYKDLPIKTMLNKIVNDYL